MAPRKVSLRTVFAAIKALNKPKGATFKQITDYISRDGKIIDRALLRKAVDDCVSKGLAKISGGKFIPDGNIAKVRRRRRRTSRPRRGIRTSHTRREIRTSHTRRGIRTSHTRRGIKTSHSRRGIRTGHSTRGIKTNHTRHLGECFELSDDIDSARRRKRGKRHSSRTRQYRRHPDTNIKLEDRIKEDKPLADEKKSTESIPDVTLSTLPESKTDEMDAAMEIEETTVEEKEPEKTLEIANEDLSVDQNDGDLVLDDIMADVDVVEEVLETDGSLQKDNSDDTQLDVGADLREVDDST